MPELLAVLAAAALLLAVVTFWQSVRSAVGAEPLTGTAEFESLSSARERTAVDEQLAATLRTLKDLELERDTDKLAEEDYQAMSGELRAQAKDLLRRREADLGPYLDRARRAVEGHLATVGLEASPDAPAASPGTDGAGTGDSASPAAEPGRSSCPTCGTENDPDARFCKGCGAPLADAGTRSTSSPPLPGTGSADQEGESR